MLSVTQYAFAVETPAAAPQAAGTNDKVEVTKDGVTTYYTTLQAAFDFIDGYSTKFDVAKGEVGGTYSIKLLADVDYAAMSTTDSYLGSILDVTLDLNGHSVISSDATKSVMNVKLGNKTYPSIFTVTDSVGGGEIRNGKWGIMFAGAYATLNFNAGKITNNHGGTTGGGICTSSNTAIININGGEISGNSVQGTSSANTGLGGGVFGFNINVTGGVITDNYAYGGTGKYTGRGGGVCTMVTGLSTAGYNYVNITGGQVYGNHADNAGDDVMAQRNGNVNHELHITTEGWFVDGWNGKSHSVGETARYDEANPVPYTTGGFERGKTNNVGLKYIAPVSTPTYTITYTDGVEGEDIFPDQVYTVEEGQPTPGFEGTPIREGYEFLGWDPEVAETVTANATYTAVWQSAIPEVPKLPELQNVADAQNFVKVYCDSDPSHGPVDVQWLPYACKVYPSNSVPAWNEELGAWTIGIRINQLPLDYVGDLEDACNGIHHDATVSEIFTTLKWDAEQALWVKTEPLELHTECRLIPLAPVHDQVDGFQVGVHGNIDGVEKKYFFNLIEGTYTIGEVKGSRAEGFTVDVVVNFADGDAYQNAWFERFAVTPGSYHYDFDRTPTSFTLTLLYNGSLTGTLYGDRTANGTVDWVILNAKGDPINYGPIVDVYLSENAVNVTYTDGVEGEEIFPDQVYSVEPGQPTPAFEGTPTREGYRFIGWAPEVSETVIGEVTYVAQWAEIVYVARLESTGEKFETLQAALDAAKALITAEGDHAAQTVTLIHNTNENVSVTFVKGLRVAYDFNLTIDLNGFTVTGLGDDSVMKFSESGSGAAKYHLYVTIKDSVGTGTITGGNATSGGAIKMTGKSGTTLTIEGGNFIGNTASSSGGAIYSGTVGMNIIINGGTFSDNTAGSGGAVAAVDLTVNGGTFSNNTANGTAQYTGRGGAIYAYGTGVVELTINGGTFSGNTASRYGDDVLFGTTRKATVKLCDPALLGAGFNAWAVDGYNGAVSGEANLSDRFSPETGVAFEDYANYSATGNMVALKLAYVTPKYTVTLDPNGGTVDPTTLVVKDGDPIGQIPTPVREGYVCTGWVDAEGNAVTAETLVTGDMTITAQWIPELPNKYGYNVVKDLLTIYCDSDPDHAPLTGKWYPQNCSIAYGAEMVWNEELGTWTIDIRINNLWLYYLHSNTGMAGTYNEIEHTEVGDDFINAQLKWDEAQGLWVPVEPIEVHSTCKTKPDAPQHYQLDSYQIKVHGFVNGEEKVYTTSIPEGAYTVGEVYGSREEGFFVDITVNPLVDGDIYQSTWIAKRNPGYYYSYDWALTPQGSITYTLKYNGSLTGTLYGNRNAVNTNVDWIWVEGTKPDQTWGVVANAYLKQDTCTVNVVIYRNGNMQTPYKTINLGQAPKGDTLDLTLLNIADYYTTSKNFVFEGWFNDGRWNQYKAGQEVSGLDKLAVNGWTNIICMVTDYETIRVNAVVNGDKANAENIYSGKVLHGTSLVEWLNENVAVEERTGYTLDKWYNWDSYGHKFNDKTTVNGWTNVYVTYTANNYTISFESAGGSACDPITVTYDAAIGELPVPAKPGYTFAGWVDAEGKPVTAETVYTVAGDSVLTATWTANTYTITFDPACDPITVTFDAPIGQLPVPTKDGYTFAGWVDAEGKPVTAETVYTVVGDSALTATWTVNTYTITFDAAGGSACDAITVTYGEAIGELPTPIRENYVFAGWLDAQGNPVDAETIYNVAGDSTLVAKWTPKTSNPDTGDNSTIGLLALMLLISCVAMGVVVSKKNRHTA